MYQDKNHCMPQNEGVSPDPLSIQLTEILKFMPPGVEPVEDFFNVLEHAALVRNCPGTSFLPEITTFTLRASYERIRELELQAVQGAELVENLNTDIKVLRTQLNVAFVNPGKGDGDTHMQIVQAEDRDPLVGLPQKLMVKAEMSDRWSSSHTRFGHYILIREKDCSMAKTWPVAARKALNDISKCVPGPHGIDTDTGEIDPQELADTVRQRAIDRENLEIEIRKLCGVEESSDITTEEAVQNLSDEVVQLSATNTRLRKELEEARNTGYIHHRAYVERLEQTLVGIGRLLGHKTFPTMEHPTTSYQQQMNNYCARLTQAIRTRMLNKKGSK